MKTPAHDCLSPVIVSVVLGAPCCILGSERPSATQAQPVEIAYSNGTRTAFVLLHDFIHAYTRTGVLAFSSVADHWRFMDSKGRLRCERPREAIGDCVDVTDSFFVFQSPEGELYAYDENGMRGDRLFLMCKSDAFQVICGILEHGDEPIQSQRFYEPCIEGRICPEPQPRADQVNENRDNERTSP